jgi:HAMP domain-containing protein
VGGIASQARPDSRGGWRLRGVKRWNASSWAGVISVFVRLVDERRQPGGLTGFVIRQGSPGLRIGPEALTMGMRGSVQNPLYLDDVPVGPEHLLGEPGRGMEVAEAALTIGRLCIAAVCLGSLKRCAQLLARYGGRRTVASGRLLDNPLVLAAQGELAARIDALEALKDQVAARLDAGRPVPPEIPMAAKVFGSDSLNWAAGQLMQSLGGRGYMENNLAPQILRDARLYSVGEGPNEPLTIQVGRKARLTGAIDGYLCHHSAGAELAGLLALSAREITDRCLNRGGPFADRSSAQLWADTLIGRVAIDTLLLAAMREARIQRPSDRLERAVAWAEIRQARGLQLAREGCPEEQLIPTPSEVTAIVALHVGAIGDIEQALAGEDDALDPYLRRTPEARSYAQEVDLPGEAVVAIDSPAEEPRPRTAPVVPPPGDPGCDLPVPNFRHGLEAVQAGDAKATAVGGRTAALLDLFPP